MNFQNFEYFIVLLLCLSGPLLLLRHPNSALRPYLKKAIPAIFVVSVPWILYDIWATDRGHWGFNPDFTVGLKIVNLPVEEVLFFWVVPFCCLTVWAEIDNFSTWPDFWQRLFLKSKRKV